MNANEYTDPEGDALTITRKAGKVWITCTTDVMEVTVGPIPATALHDKTLGSYIRTDEPDLMDGGVIAAFIEQEAEPWRPHHVLRAERDQARADRDMAERERDEALRTVQEVVDSHDETLRDIASGKYAAESRPFTAREHLTAAWEAAHVPEDATIPAGADYLWRSAATGRIVQGFPDEEPSRAGAGGAIERRLLDPPAPARPEGAEEIEALLSALDAAGEDWTDPAGTADYLARHGIGVRVVTEEQS